MIIIKKFLLKLIRNGPDEYPGAKILERKNWRKYFSKIH